MCECAEGTELKSPTSSSYEEDDNLFDEESFYNGTNEDETRCQEEELSCMEEVKLNMLMMNMNPLKIL